MHPFAPLSPSPRLWHLCAATTETITLTFPVTYLGGGEGSAVSGRFSFFFLTENWTEGILCENKKKRA